MCTYPYVGLQTIDLYQNNKDFSFIFVIIIDSNIFFINFFSVSLRLKKTSVDETSSEESSGGGPMANVMASIGIGQVKLRKAKVEEKKPLAPADPMASMIASIRSGNVALRKVQKETKV
ncbi:PREDICTED: uncharacterized protein LOC109591529 [Amphimedon queenslandica]|uniref:WH2 domain-containing protein n=2 Tax=Amphimedon queenslandica TaxID=400682 RepID=A0AAN0K0M0_AMPQE|nr:PREDICTED: uncharacterized protein LOC109591529 [Amphimedon queenslandica]|eukprot:XP_019862809.1 PREDICTED: uncharacterized protein LOC109591529 [Amphimedon queenslandica]